MGKAHKDQSSKESKSKRVIVRRDSLSRESRIEEIPDKDFDLFMKDPDVISWRFVAEIP